MASHSDSDHEMKARVLDELRMKAELMEDLGKNDLALGNVQSESRLDGIHIRQLPPDKQGVLRLSIGGRPDMEGTQYLTYRGDTRQCVELLEQALSAIKSHIPEMRRQRQRKTHV